jgi:uncharacterized protein (TIGR03435 family)
MSALTMIGDHLWQSTLCAGLAALVALALRRHGARVRYAVWLAASLKFLVPVAALAAIGGALSWKTVEVVPYAPEPVVMQAISEPFSQTPVTVPPAPPGTDMAWLLDALPRVVLALWAGGALLVLGHWARQWRRMRRLAHAAPRLPDGREVDVLRRLAPRHGVTTVPILVTDTATEPGIFGIVRPVLLWPRAIGTHLSDAQVEAVLAHELCHLRRRDNLAAALHMGVQAAFWFHPLVWWIGARLVDERERACDEEVLRLGSEPDVYAESILRTCKFFLESPLACVAGVTGSNLKTRIEAIMTHDPRPPLDPWRRALLATAGILAFVTPVAVGALNPPPQTRQVAPAASLPAFEAISIRPNTSPGRGGRAGGQMQPGRFVVQNATLRTILRRAFAPDGRVGPGAIPDLFDQQVAGGPEWIDQDKFDITATTAAPTEPAEMRRMVQRLLADRFMLVAHWEKRELPVYVLRRARADGQLPSGVRPVSEEACAKLRDIPRPMPPPPPGQPAPPPPCGAIQFGPGLLLASGAPMDWLANALTGTPVITGIDRIVRNRTGLEGNYAFELKFSPPQAANPDPDRPQLFTALEDQLGIRLEAAREPVDVLVVDSLEKPAAN